MLLANIALDKFKKSICMSSTLECSHKKVTSQLIYSSKIESKRVQKMGTQATYLIIVN